MGNATGGQALRPSVAPLAEEEIMECYRVHIPIGTRVAGSTANGEATGVLPGEYLVHRLSPKLSTRLSPVLRLVGADPAGRDVHLPLEALGDLPAPLGVELSQARSGRPAGSSRNTCS